MKLRNLLESSSSKYVNEFGGIDLCSKFLSVLPRDLPTKINDSFYCSFNQLTSLKYCTTSVGRDFYCHNNQLTSLQYCPAFVGRDFFCDRNQLKTLRYLPKEIGGDIILSHNLDCYVELFYLCNVKLGGDLLISDNRELADLFNEKYKNTGTRGMLKFQNYLEDKYDLT